MLINQEIFYSNGLSNIKTTFYHHELQENHNIFAKLSPDEYREVLGNVKHCILATDLALFFPNKARLTNILKEEAFSWDLPDHRYVSRVSPNIQAKTKPTVKKNFIKFH